MVLNSTALSKKAIELIGTQGYKKVLLFLDNDSSGDTKKQEFVYTPDKVVVVDKSYMYKDYKDFNEYLKSSVP